MTQLEKHIVFLLIAVVSFIALPVFAQSPGDIKVTTTTEVAVPGHLLEPGTYWFRRAMADDPSVYKVVADNGRVIEFVEVLPTERTGRTDTEVDVTDPDAAGVRVLQAWYGPGDPSGYQLVYSKGDISKAGSNRGDAVALRIRCGTTLELRLPVFPEPTAPHVRALFALMWPPWLLRNRKLQAFVVSPG